MFIVSGAKIHLFLPTILYILTIHLYFLPFAHFLLFTLHILFLFVLQSKDFIVFLQKNQTTYQMKRNKKTFYTLLYIGHFSTLSHYSPSSLYPKVQEHRRDNDGTSRGAHCNRAASTSGCLASDHHTSRLSVEKECSGSAKL